MWEVEMKSSRLSPLNFIRIFFKFNKVYKITSLLIAILLWLIISSRREFEVSKNFDIEFRLKDQVVVQNLSSSIVKVSLFGPRASLKKVIDGSWPNVFIVDVTHLNPGHHRIRLERNRVELPLGARAISLNPNFIEFDLSLFQEASSGASQ